MLNADAGDPRHPAQLPLPKHHQRGQGARRARSEQGRRRPDRGERRAAGDRSAGSDALHAGRLHDHAARDAGQPRGQAGAGCGPVDPGRTAALASLLLAADCTVTIAHSKTVDLPERCREADILRGHRPAADDQGRLGQARRRGDRHRRQPGAVPRSGRRGRGQDQGGGRCGFQGRPPGRRLDHAGAGRRGPDDGRLLCCRTPSPRRR